MWSHIRIYGHTDLTDRYRYLKKVTSINAGNTSTSHLDSSVRYRLVRAMQLGKDTITTPRLSARPWVSSHHYHACRSCFSGWHLYMQLLGAVLTFVQAAALLRACDLLSCKHMGHRNPVLRVVPFGKCNYHRLVIPCQRQGGRAERACQVSNLFVPGVYGSRYDRQHLPLGLQ